MDGDKTAANRQTKMQADENRSSTSVHCSAIILAEGMLSTKIY